MSISEKLKIKPYYDTSEYEYYEKGYKKLLGIPGRVLQGREITALSSFPLFILKDLLDTEFRNLQVIQKINYNFINKIISENQTLISFDNPIIVNENTLTVLEEKYIELKDLLVSNHTEEQDLPNIKIYINDKNNECKDFINNFNNKYKPIILAKLSSLSNDINSYYNFVRSLETVPANLDNLLNIPDNVNTAVETTNVAIVSSNLFIEDLKKILSKNEVKILKTEVC